MSTDLIVATIDEITTQLFKNVTTTVGKQKLAIYVTNSNSTFDAKVASSRLMQ
ncbi:MAG: hypothetical protein LBQ31_01760 [Bacteroidales bacterium]|jgi:hypothetical protein|nr:hypothetical protein [Bacteroidales bacterium]